MVSLVRIDILLSELFQDFKGWASLPIQGLHVVNQVLDEHAHVFLISYYQIYVPVLQLESNAVPTVKGNAFLCIYWCRINVLSQHPEPWGLRAVKDALNLAQVTWRAGVTLLILILILWLAYSVVLNWVFGLLYNALCFSLSLFFLLF